MNRSRALGFALTLVFGLGLAACLPRSTPEATPVMEAPTEAIPPAPTPAGHEELIRAGADPFSATKEGSVVSGSRDRYRFEAAAGELLEVQIASLESNAAIVLLGPDGDGIPGAQPGQDATSWVGVLPVGGVYAIEVGPTRGNTTYTLTVKIGAVAYQPLSEDRCAPLQASAQEVMGLEFSAGATAFVDPVSGGGGEACTLQAHATGIDIESPQAVLDVLGQQVFTGWTEKPEYAADGPTGSARGYVSSGPGSGQNLEFLLLTTVEWQPVPDANCPADQPISDCPLNPEQKLYTITLLAAQREAQ